MNEDNSKVVVHLSWTIEHTNGTSMTLSKDFEDFRDAAEHIDNLRRLETERHVKNVTVKKWERCAPGNARLFGPIVFAKPNGPRWKAVRLPEMNRS